MRNIRYILRLTVAFLSKFKGIIILGIGAGLVLFLLLSWVIPLVSTAQAVRIGIAGRFTPSTLPNSILSQVGHGLTSLTPSGEVAQGLASSWETSDDGKVWTFHLKEEIYWQDGKRVESDALNYQFSDSEVERPDANTIVFKLQNPYSPFPSVVSAPVFKKGLLGTGEWKVKKISLAGEFVDRLLIENASKDKILYKFYPSEERLKLAFKLGQIDEISNVMDPKPLDAWDKATITESENKGEYVAAFFNTQDKNLSEKTFRQALAYAIDKANLEGMRAISPISEDSWAYNPQVKPYDFDQKKAKDAIKAEVEINLATSPTLLATAEKIAKDWEAIGVKTNVQVYSVIPNDYQALLAIFDTPEDPDQYSIWHSTQTSTNITKYSNPRIDKLLEDGRTQKDQEERKKIYLDFQRFLVEDSPAIFLYYPTTYTISRN